MRSGWSFSRTAKTPSAPVCEVSPGVNGRAEAGGARAGEEVVVPVDVAAELERVLLGAREVDAHHAVVPVALGLPDDDVVQRVVELAREAEDQPRADAVREARALHPVDGGHDDVVEVPLAAQVPLHGVEAELDGRDARGAVLLPDDRVDRALDGRGRRLDALGPAVEDLEVAVQRRDALRIGVHEVLELGVGAHGQLEAVVVRDLPEDVGRHRRAHVDVEVDELGRLEEPPARVGDGELAGSGALLTGVIAPPGVTRRGAGSSPGASAPALIRRPGRRAPRPRSSPRRSG